MLWSLPLAPLAAGIVIWTLRPAMAASGHRSPQVTRDRVALGTCGAMALAATLAIAVWAAVTQPSAAYRWGAGLSLHARLGDVGGIVAVLVPAIALPIVG